MRGHTIESPEYSTSVVPSTTATIVLPPETAYVRPKSKPMSVLLRYGGFTFQARPTMSTQGTK